MEKYKDENDYVQHFWEHCKPVAQTKQTRIYVIRGEESDFPELIGRQQLCLMECNSGQVMEVN